MLNKKTLKVIQSLNQISNKAIFSYPVTCVREGKSIQAFLDMSKLDEEEFESFGIFSLSDFLSAISLIDNPEITLKEKAIDIKDGKSSVVYRTSPIELLEDECQCDLELLDRVKSNPKIGEFALSADEFKNLKIASNTLKDLPDLLISNTKSGISLKIIGREKSSNSFETIIEGKADEDFNLIANLALLKKVPNGDYKVEIFKSLKSESRILLFKSENIESLEILFAVKQN